MFVLVEEAAETITAVEAELGQPVEVGDIKYPNAIWDEDEQWWISEAEIAETSYTAFAQHLDRDDVVCRG